MNLRSDADVLVVDLLDLVAAVLARLAPAAAGSALLVAPAHRLAASACLGHQRPPRVRPAAAGAWSGARGWSWKSWRPLLVRWARRECRRRRLAPATGAGWKSPSSTGSPPAGAPLPGANPPPADGVVARAQELHRVGNDIDCLAFAAVLCLPLAPLQAPVDRHGTPLGQVAGGVLALRAPHGDVEVVGLVLPFAGAPVLAAGVAGDSQAAHRRCRWAASAARGRRSGFRSGRPG